MEAIAVDQIKIQWRQSTTSAQKDAVRGSLAPWLYGDETERERVPLQGSLRRNPVPVWEMVFKEYGLNTAYYFSDLRMEANNGVEEWLRTQMLPPNSTRSSLGMTLLFETLTATSQGEEDTELHNLCSDLIGRTLSLVARGHSENKAHEMIKIDPERIYPFLELETTSPTDEDVEGAWEEMFADYSEYKLKTYDPSGHRLQKSIAFGLRRGCLVQDTSIVKNIVDKIRVSKTELLTYVGMSHHYLDSIHPNGDLSQGWNTHPDVATNGDDNGMLNLNLTALVEALGPRVNQKPSSYDPVDTRDDSNNLIGAVLSNNYEMVFSLLSQPYGLEPDECQDSYGCTALIWASRRGFIPLVDLLLASGADPNKQARKMGTALHWASSYGQPQSCLRLMRAGGRLDLLDDGGATPVECIGRFVDPKYVMFHLNSQEENEAIMRDPHAPNPMHTDTIVRTVDLQKNRGDSIKRKGNIAFGKKNYKEALKCYQDALEEYAFECPIEKAIIYSNRAQCHLNLKDCAQAKKDALLALRHDPTNPKAQYRLDRAEEGLVPLND